jgi:chromate transport protein ChrA
MFGFLFLVLVYSFYEKDEQKKAEGEMLSSMGVASIAVTALTAWGTFIKNSQDIPMIQNDIFLWILAPTIVFIVLWIYSK